MARFINQGFTLSSQVVGVTTDYTASAGEVLLCDTTSGGITVTLPDSPAVGDRVQFVDAAGQFGANNVLVSVSDTSTYKIANLNETLLLNVPNQPLELMWSGGTYGWVLLNT
jgi:hypothetical protein